MSAFLYKQLNSVYISENWYHGRNKTRLARHFICDWVKACIVNLNLLCFFAEACEKTFCRWGAECVSLGDGRAHCACPASCPNTAAAVCSTVGRTYRNHCFLRKEACERRLNLRVRHEGECGEFFNPS